MNDIPFIILIRVLNYILSGGASMLPVGLQLVLGYALMTIVQHQRMPITN